MGTGNGDARSLIRILNFQNIYLNSLGRLKYLALYLLSLVQDSVHTAQIDADIASVITLNNTGNDILLFLIPLAVLLTALLLADLLKDHVLRVLSRNSSERLGLNRHMNGVAKVVLRVTDSCLCKADLGYRIFHGLNNLF